MCSRKLPPRPGWGSMRPLIAPASSYKILRNFSHDPCIFHMATQIKRAISRRNSFPLSVPLATILRNPFPEARRSWKRTLEMEKIRMEERVQIGNKIGRAERDMAKSGCQSSLPPFLSLSLSLFLSLRTDARGRRFLFTRPRKVAH